MKTGRKKRSPGLSQNGRTKNFIGLFALALLVAAGYGVNQKVKSNANLSDLALANVEALAQNENGNDYCDEYCMLASGWTCTVYSNGVPWLPCYGYRKKS